MRKRILLVSAGWFHPPYRGRMWLREALAELPNHAVEDDVSTLAEAAERTLSTYDALVLYYHHRDAVLATDDLEAFRRYVHGGGGILALHSATASYKPTAAYFEILGGRFAGHGPVTRFAISPAHADDPIFGDIPAFAVTDELYLHELQPDIEVRFHADYRGTPTPVVWTRTVGSGRVCYIGPGHRSASMRNPAVRAIVQRGMRWVSGELP